MVQGQLARDRGYKRVGHLIRKTRQAAKIPAHALAKHLGVSPEFISRIERGERPMPLARWHLLIALFPTLTFHELATLTLEDGPIAIDAMRLPAAARAEVVALVAASAEARGQRTRTNVAAA